MYDAHWEDKDAGKSERFSRAAHSEDARTAPNGWWIVPFAILGLLSWIGIFYLILK